MTVQEKVFQIRAVNLAQMDRDDWLKGKSDVVPTIKQTPILLSDVEGVERTIHPANGSLISYADVLGKPDKVYVVPETALTKITFKSEATGQSRAPLFLATPIRGALAPDLDPRADLPNVAFIRAAKNAGLIRHIEDPSLQIPPVPAKQTAGGVKEWIELGTGAIGTVAVAYLAVMAGLDLAQRHVYGCYDAPQKSPMACPVLKDSEDTFVGRPLRFLGLN